jgi:uncharacterized membrane protein YbhN (UPF0104 family)
VIQVSDQLERRIRKPVDALRCVISCAWIVVLAGAALAASATTTGVETDIVGASRRLPHALLVVVPPIALFALLILPIALAVAQLVKRQARRLFEAAATGLVAGAAAQVANILLPRPEADRLYYAIIMSHPGGPRVDALDPYLAGLVAYVTMVGLTGRPGWRNALGLTVGVYAVVQLAALHTTGPSILLTLLAGHATGLAVRYAAGSLSQRPPALAVASALSASDLPVTGIWRVPVRQSHAGVAGSRHYVAATQGGGQLDVIVFDRDQQAAGTFYGLYRWIRVRGQVAPSAPLSVDRALERRALLSYATQDAGVPTPRLRTLVRVGPDAAVLAYDYCAGNTLARRALGCTDAELGSVWDMVIRLHEHHVAHRGLTADRMLFTPDGQVMLLDPGDGDVAASDLQRRLDLAQLIVELALYVGPERSAQLALEKVSGHELGGVLPLLQPVALVRTTRHALRHRRDVLPAVRKALLAAVPAEDVAPVRLERIRARTLVTLVASVAAVYLLAGELAQDSLGQLLKSADWRWGLAALALSVLTYTGATLSVSGFVAQRLGFIRTLLVQLASSFVTLVTPAAVGGVALNVRFLQRQKISSPVAVASIAVSQVVALALHVLLLASFGAIAGAGDGSSIRPPTWAYFVVAGLLALAGAVLAVPAGRRVVRARLSPTFGQVMPQLIEVAQHPRKLAEGFGGALLLSLSYIACLSACVAAFGGSVPIAKIGVVYLTGSALGSIIPTPGGLGAVEAALTAGLTAAGVPGGVAVSAVLLFRLLTFWLPVPFGWVALNYLERQHDVLPLAGLPVPSSSPGSRRPGTSRRSGSVSPPGGLSRGVSPGLAQGDPLDTQGVDQPRLRRGRRDAAGELGDQGDLVPAGRLAQFGGFRRGQQQLPGDQGRLGGHPGRAAESGGQVEAVDREFQDPGASELDEQHAVAVPGPHHALGWRGPQQGPDALPGLVEVADAGGRAVQRPRVPAGRLDALVVGGRREPLTGPVVAPGGHQRAPGRRGLREHAAHPGRRHPQVAEQLGHRPRRARAGPGEGGVVDPRRDLHQAGRLGVKSREDCLGRHGGHPNRGRGASGHGLSGLRSSGLRSSGLRSSGLGSSSGWSASPGTACSIPLPAPPHPAGLENVACCHGNSTD